MNIRSQAGQSLIELIMVLPLFLAMWAAMVWFARVLIIKIELLHAARHGIFWLAYNPDDSMTPGDEIRQVEAECKDFIRHQDPGLTISHLHLAVEPGDRWTPIGRVKLKELPQIFTLAERLRRVFKDAAGLIRFQPAKITLEYDLETPPLLRLIAGFPPTVPLRGYCVCYR